ncbi:DUF2975 domain-containing protein [Microbacterium horticulturae]|uniref:DUF2975 domain-containing protein n=1 Tax=Microbacterium horticulturae TaxID=3028316 RepID=A0ABY8BZU9_9MICO|nr:DUF2975 domain-containing protein [Microbacterium sp. KACC 23027]WEG09679.1 DUF2975 domain-containing protein [Microbacterium sp. KACC 23027]
MRDAAVLLTRVFIVLLFAALLVGQVWVVPSIAGDTASTAPEFAGLRVPGIVLTVLLLVCVQVVLVCVWRLLSLVDRDEIFQPRAFGWVNTIVIAVLAAVVLVIVGMVLIDRAQAGTPLVLIGGVLAIIVGLGIALVVVVLKELLRQAVQLEQDLSEVV